MKDIEEERLADRRERRKKRNTGRRTEPGSGGRGGEGRGGKKGEWKRDGLPKILEGWNYGSKNRNQSHWLKAAYPREYLVEAEPREPRLPGLSVSTCLPLPPIPLFLLHPASLLPPALSPQPSSSSSSSYSSSSSSSASSSRVSSPVQRAGQRGASNTGYHLYPWFVAHRYAESFHANSAGTPSLSAGPELVPPLKP